MRTPYYVTGPTVKVWDFRYRCERNAGMTFPSFGVNPETGSLVGPSFSGQILENCATLRYQDIRVSSVNPNVSYYTVDMLTDVAAQALLLDPTFSDCTVSANVDPSLFPA